MTGSPHCACGQLTNSRLNLESNISLFASCGWLLRYDLNSQSILQRAVCLAETFIIYPIHALKSFIFKNSASLREE